jgi:Brp/Blh family beta-carotene 15,15'-monooxygenase
MYRFGLVYLLLMAVVASLFIAAPSGIIALFTVLSAWHFGAAHVGTESLLMSKSLPRLAYTADAPVACGSFALGIPLVAWPAESTEVAGELCGLTGRSPAIEGFVTQGLGFGLLVVALLTGGREFARHAGSVSGRRWLRRRAEELAVIGLLATVAHPLFSVGCYFLFWHAWREMGSLSESICGRPPGSGRLSKALVGVHVAALPLLLPTWGALVFLWWLLPAGALDRTPRGLAVLSLAVYVVVTPSHEFLRLWLRRSQASCVEFSHCEREPGSADFGAGCHRSVDR